MKNDRTMNDRQINTNDSFDQRSMMEQNDAFQRLYSDLRKGFEGIMEAAEIAAAETDNDPKFPERFNDAFPNISEATIRQLVSVGRRKVHIDWYLNGSPGARTIRELPYPVQERYTREKVPVLTDTEGDANDKTILADVRDLSQRQADQVFDKRTGMVRTASQQRLWLIEQRNAQELRNSKTAEENAPWRVVKGKVVLPPSSREIVIDLGTLSRMMQEAV